MIENISIKKLFPHPKNPRRNIGDVSELAESIKKNGVLQNLTVVPGKTDGTYTVVIGHRRMAAAKAAGLDTVPCVIADMTDEEQFHTMLTENMQRSDLTPMEQAQGFQIMFDEWGYDEKKIAETTGFSESTVRHRLNMAKLKIAVIDGYELKSGFQLSLSDFYALEKVPTLTERNQILVKANNPQQIRSLAAEAEAKARRDKAAKQVMKLLKDAIPDIKPFPESARVWDGTWERIKNIPLDNDIPDKISIGKAKKADKLYYEKTIYNINIYRKKPKEKKEKTEYEKQVDEREERKKQMDKIFKNLASRRRDFVLAVLDGKLDDPKDTAALKDDMWRFMASSSTWVSISEMKAYITGKPTHTLDVAETAAVYNKISNMSVLHQMLILMCREITSDTCFDYYGRYYKEKAIQLKSVYNLLMRWGFVLEDEEKDILNGTHELYTPSEPEKESEVEA